MSLRILSIITLVAFASATASGTNLITNGDFETGDFSGWSVYNGPFYGNWYVLSGTVTPDSGHPTVGPASGIYYALTDQDGGGSHVLLQSFTVGAGGEAVAFDMFVNNWAGVTYCDAGLTATNGPVECGRVDILTAAADPFDTGAGVVQNLYLGSYPSGPWPYTAYSFVLNLPAGTYQLRFGEADNQLWFNMGVDNVSVTPLPEPGTMIIFGTGILGVAGVIRQKIGL